jgi:hypothetical protein
MTEFFRDPKQVAKRFQITNYVAPHGHTRAAEFLRDVLSKVVVEEIHHFVCHLVKKVNTKDANDINVMDEISDALHAATKGDSITFFEYALNAEEYESEKPFPYEVAVRKTNEWRREFLQAWIDQLA